MANNNDRNGVGLVDAAAGAGAGAVVAASTSAIYGMSKLKDAKTTEILATAFSESVGHAKKMQPVLDKILKENVIDREKFSASMQAIVKEHGLDRTGDLKKAGELSKEAMKQMSSAEADKLYGEVQKAVIGAIKVDGATDEQLGKILDSVRQVVKDGDLKKFGASLKANGIFSIKGAAIKDEASLGEHNQAIASALKNHPAQKPIGEIINLAEDYKERVAKFGANPEAVKKAQEQMTDAFAQSVKIGKTPDEIKKLMAEDPQKLSTELQSALKKAYADNKDAIGKEAKKTGARVFTSFENAGRKILGSAKYKAAPAYAKPVVAFEAMPTKGKVALGLVVLGTTALGTMIAPKLHGGSHAEAVRQASSDGQLQK
jgi:hypothetical protein